jgi:hypothetical protein
MLRPDLDVFEARRAEHRSTRGVRAVAQGSHPELDSEPPELELSSPSASSTSSGSIAAHVGESWGAKLAASAAPRARTSNATAFLDLGDIDREYSAPCIRAPGLTIASTRTHSPVREPVDRRLGRGVIERGQDRRTGDVDG